MRWLVVIAGGITILGAAFVAALPSKPVKEPVKVEKKFDTAWKETVEKIATSEVPKTVIAGPKPVVTERILPEPTAAPEEEETPVQVRKRPSKKTYDICRGKGKRYIRGGKSWRCRR